MSGAGGVGGAWKLWSESLNSGLPAAPLRQVAQGGGRVRLEGGHQGGAGGAGGPHAPGQHGPRPTGAPWSLKLHWTF